MDFVLSAITPPTGTMIIEAGEFNRHEVRHSSKSLFSGSTVGRMIVQSDGRTVGLLGTGAGW